MTNIYNGIKKILVNNLKEAETVQNSLELLGYRKGFFIDDKYPKFVMVVSDITGKHTTGLSFSSPYLSFRQFEEDFKSFKKTFKKTNPEEIVNLILEGKKIKVLLEDNTWVEGKHLKITDLNNFNSYLEVS